MLSLLLASNMVKRHPLELCRQVKAALDRHDREAEEADTENPMPALSAGQLSRELNAQYHICINYLKIADLFGYCRLMKKSSKGYIVLTKRALSEQQEGA